jgi:hypothetical protein
MAFMEEDEPIGAWPVVVYRDFDAARAHATRANVQSRALYEQARRLLNEHHARMRAANVRVAAEDSPLLAIYRNEMDAADWSNIEDRHPSRSDYFASITYSVKTVWLR